MPSAVIEPAVPAIKRPQTYVSDRTATGISLKYVCIYIYIYMHNTHLTAQ